jgi:hypothetical protein
VIGWLIDASAKNRALVLFAAIALAIGGVTARRDPRPLRPAGDRLHRVAGRSPTLVEDQVTYPITSALLAAPKVEAVRGYSMFGMSFVYVLFAEGRRRLLGPQPRARVPEHDPVPPPRGRHPDPRPRRHRHRLGLRVRPRRSQRPARPRRAAQHPGLQPPLRLESVPGVAQVASVGGFEKQYQVTARPRPPARLRLSVSTSPSAIRRSNAEVGGRVLEIGGREYFIRGRGYLAPRGTSPRSSSSRAGALPSASRRRPRAPRPRAPARPRRARRPGRGRRRHRHALRRERPRRHRARQGPARRPAPACRRASRSCRPTTASALIDRAIDTLSTP